MKRNIYHLVLLILAFTYSNSLIGQAPIDQIQGPHTEYEGPYYIQVFVNYVQPTDPIDQWTTNVDLTARTAATWRFIKPAAFGSPCLS